MDYTSLLFEACETGELQAVKTIVQGLPGVDVVNPNKAPYYPYCPRPSSSPLFVAARYCHLDIARYLIHQGADVNSRSDGDSSSDIYFGMTPLHAAASATDKSWSQKRAMIELLFSSGADATALTSRGESMWMLFNRLGRVVEERDIVELGVNLTRQFPSKNCGALHHWSSGHGLHAAEGGNSVPIVELLVAEGADLRALDHHGLSPLYVAATGFPNCEGAPIINAPALEYHLSRDEYSLQEKINALELAGAMLLIYKMSFSSDFESTFSEAMYYWEKSLNLREQGSAIIIPKVLLNVQSSVAWWAIEWTTRDELEELRYRSIGQVNMQAVLVARRILSGISSKALVRCLWFKIYPYSNLLRHHTHNRVLEVCWMMLEGARVADDSIGTELWEMIQPITSYIQFSLLALKEEQNLNSETLTLSLQLVLDTRSKCPTLPYYDLGAHGTKYFYLRHEEFYQFVSMLALSPEMMTEDIKRLLREFVDRDLRDRFGYNLLLMACNRIANDDKEENLAMIRFLLEVAGANPNVKNVEGDSPLHLVAYRRMGVIGGNEMKAELDSPTAALLLVQHGAHLDVVNNLQQTPLDVWKEKREEAGSSTLSPPAWLNPLHPLYCWSTRVIQRSGISYAHLPKSVQDFVALHE